MPGGKHKSPVSAQGRKTIRLTFKKKEGVRDHPSGGIDIYSANTRKISQQRSLKQ